MEILVIGLLGMLAVAGASALSERVGVAAPLLLVVVGLVVSQLPGVPVVEVDPEWVLAGIVPPLLFSSAVSMPTMNFRREFGAISGLSVLLVVASTAVIGVVLAAVVPGLGLAAGFALGAILSPTDAVATGIVKRVGVSARVTTVLDGESMLNDATALVVLRAAIAATAASVSIGGVLGDFALAVAVAVAVGLAVGWVGLRVRARVSAARVGTVISYALPFAASLPAEALGGSGLVAAVVAGLLTGQGAIRHLSPQDRLSDRQNWRTMETLLEGAIFLIMGLQLPTVLGDLHADGGSVGQGVALAALALVLTLVVRAAYTAPLLALQRRLSRRKTSERSELQLTDQALDSGVISYRGRSRDIEPENVDRFRSRLRRRMADIDYLLAEPLGAREGAVIVWAGMRGAVTLAAAQTLPEDAPQRSLLVVVAFLVAAASLLFQGSTLAWVVHRVKPAGPDPEAAAAERDELQSRMRAVAIEVLKRHPTQPWAAEFLERSAEKAGTPDPTAMSDLRLEMIRAQRESLVAARAEGRFDAAALSAALETLDAEQINIEMRAG
ncbi:cation:proton antiporter [Pseudonocardia endophytica]|uniref:Sodium/proton antiporter (CPA1 family) n=1 Tax=Pseudonocardia endophytica TaxID=401976 RepID=A0A4R1HU95_PSEEN|nr:sodium:proton antiporter [Pseudonocardia endophytica]TCK25828.1 sodium/proton antiporter (CPA1 family) [Pseudonocardia endophytica]